MKVSVVRIGNSKGIRIPKSVLSECEIADAVNLEIKGNRIILSPTSVKPRQGWDAAAERMRKAGDDRLLVPDVLDEDFEWELE